MSDPNDEIDTIEELIVMSVRKAAEIKLEAIVERLTEEAQQPGTTWEADYKESLDVKEFAIETSEPHRDDDSDSGDTIDLEGGLPEVRTADPAVADRRWLTIALIIVLCIVIVGTGILIATEDLTPESSKDVLPYFVGPLFTLLGTVVTFYFTSRRN